MKKENTITLQTAKKWAKTWRKRESTYNKYHECKAFNIPKADLIGVLEEDVASVRAYIGVKEFVNKETGEKVYEEKLMIVGVDKNGKDMISSKDGESLDSEGGHIFDMTRPCPNHCDPNSPLNGEG